MPSTTTRSRSTPTRRPSSRPLAAAAEPEVVYVQAPPGAAPAPAAPAGIDMEQLKQLGELHAAGVLTDEEFAAAKAKLLG